jgi:hypothetical protein
MISNGSAFARWGEVGVSHYCWIKSLRPWCGIRTPFQPQEESRVCPHRANKHPPFSESNNLSRIEPMPFLADRSLNSEQQERVCFDVHYGTGIALPGQGSGP